MDFLPCREWDRGCENNGICSRTRGSSSGCLLFPLSSTVLPFLLGGLPLFAGTSPLKGKRLLPRTVALTFLVQHSDIGVYGRDDCMCQYTSPLRDPVQTRPNFFLWSWLQKASNFGLIPSLKELNSSSTIRLPATPVRSLPMEVQCRQVLHDSPPQLS